MSRMLKALKQLEARRSDEPQPEAVEVGAAAEAADESPAGRTADSSQFDEPEMHAAQAPDDEASEPQANVSQTYVLPRGGLGVNPFITPKRRMTEAWPASSNEHDDAPEEPVPAAAADVADVADVADEIHDAPVIAAEADAHVDAPPAASSEPPPLPEAAPAPVAKAEPPTSGSPTSTIPLGAALDGIDADILNWVSSNLPGRSSEPSAVHKPSVEAELPPAVEPNLADATRIGEQRVGEDRAEPVDAESAADESGPMESTGAAQNRIDRETSEERFELEESGAKEEDGSRFESGDEDAALPQSARDEAPQNVGTDAEKDDNSVAERAADADAEVAAEAPAAPKPTTGEVQKAAPSPIADADNSHPSKTEHAAEATADRDLMKLLSADVESDSATAAPNKSSRPTAGGMLKNRFQEPARPAADAASLEEEVERSLGDERIAPQYRHLAANVRGQYPGDVSSVLLLTAPAANLRLGETLMHLAALLAESSDSQEEEQPRVLVVDACLSGKLLTGRMHSTGKPGLAEVLGRRKEWRDYVAPTARERIDFLPAGDGPVTSYKSIGGKLAPLLDEWKGQYRYVLVDAGAADEPLTHPLAQACDATYLHVALAETAREAAQQAAERLRTAGARLRGCVVEQ